MGVAWYLVDVLTTGETLLSDVKNENIVLPAAGIMNDGITHYQRPALNCIAASHIIVIMPVYGQSVNVLEQ